MMQFICSLAAEHVEEVKPKTKSKKTTKVKTKRKPK
jgi:hypothetical protein